MKALLVEDDGRLRDILATGLPEHGIQVVAAPTYAEGRRLAVFESFDVLVVDGMLPGGDGFELCRALRAKGDETPILILTARSALDDRVEGFESGADDYLTKPFAVEELVARLRALARRPPSLLPRTFRLADLAVDLRGRHVVRAGRTVELTNKEWDLLECFVRNPGTVLSREDITTYVWDSNHDPFTNALEVLVRRLRAKVDEPFDPPLIHTHRGAGYRFGL